MELVKVTAKQSHLGAYGMMKPGDIYETDNLHAQELVNSGLVTAPGITGKEEVKDGPVADVLYNAAREKTGDFSIKLDKEKQENKTGNVPTAVPAVKAKKPTK